MVETSNNQRKLPKAYVTVSNTKAAALEVLGLNVLKRNVRSLKAAGFDVVVNEDPKDQESYLTIEGDAQYKSSLFRTLKTAVMQNLAQNFILETEDGKTLPIKWHGSQTEDGKILKLENQDYQNISTMLEASPRVQIKKQLSKTLFDEIYQNAQGWIAKGINKRISFPLSRLLVKFPITPNQITVLCFLIGLAGCLLFLSTAYGWRVFGAVLLQFSSILDGCDGEVARLKVIRSKLGAWLDTISDDVLNNVMLICLCVGYFSQYPNVFLIKFFVLGTISSLGMSFFLYHFMINHKTPNMADFHFSWAKEQTSIKMKKEKTFYDLYLNPILKRDFIVFFVMTMVIFDQRLVLLGLFVPVMGAFLLYFASFIYGMATSPARYRF